MVDVQTEITIRKPVWQVAEYASDPDNAPNWYKNIDAVTWRTPRPLTIGTIVEFTARFLGRKLSYTYEVTDFIPGERMTMRTAEGPFPMETTYVWKAIDEKNTTMFLRNRGKPSGFALIFTPIMSIMIRQANKKDLREIKIILESQ